MIETARQISDFVFRWCGIWLVMNAVTRAAELARWHVLTRRKAKFSREMFQVAEEFERTGEKEPEAQEDTENAGEESEDPENRRNTENAVQAE